jgi:methyl-accepting chemotaxis protein
MKRLGFKLIGGFVILLLMIAAIAFYSSASSRKSLQESIGQDSVFVASEMLVNINMAVYNWLDRLELRTLDGGIQQAVDLSNRQFAAGAFSGDYSDMMEAEWRAAAKGGAAPAVQRIVASDLSQVLRNLYFTHYGKKEGDRIVTEVIVTNSYGATVAATGAGAQYRFDGTALWRSAKEKGPAVGESELDSGSGQVIIPIAVPIVDAHGAFSGAILVKVSADSITRNAVSTYKKYQGTQVMVMTADGKLVNSTKAFRFMDDVSKEPFFRSIEGASGSFVSMSAGRATLFSYARSQAYLTFVGMPWTLVMENDVGEVLAPSVALRDNILIASLILLALGIAVAVLISRSITRPVAELQAAVSEITRGNLSRSINVRGRDELGMLAASFVEMRKALLGIAAFSERIAMGDLTMQAIRRSEEDILGISLENMLANLRRQTSEILDGANVLAEAASEIFASTSQFAANSSQTAAAVSQTTTTIEEVQQGVHLSNEKAKQLADKARRTEEIAVAGRVSVEETTKVMIGRIREQMDTISESIMRLSEQSASIGEITTTVSDLADQSNLLAVNAAIEAAKAGEQGKGFGVVAQEIKSLAEQSKRATAQVRSLLTEIQKATSGAVMATDQGSKAVDQGMKQAGEAKESIQGLAETVAEAAMGAAQIAASSEQQRIGMDQVAMAMESIKVATVQGVEGTKQLEVEAQNLYKAGQKLKQLVELVRM